MLSFSLASCTRSSYPLPATTAAALPLEHDSTHGQPLANRLFQIALPDSTVTPAASARLRARPGTRWHSIASSRQAVPAQLATDPLAGSTAGIAPPRPLAARHRPASAAADSSDTIFIILALLYTILIVAGIVLLARFIARQVRRALRPKAKT